MIGKKSWKQPKCSPIGNWLTKLRNIHLMKYSGAIKNDCYENYGAPGEKASVLMHSGSTEYKLWLWEVLTECPTLWVGHRVIGCNSYSLEAPGPIAWRVVKTSNDSWGWEKQWQRVKELPGSEKSALGSGLCAGFHREWALGLEPCKYVDTYRKKAWRQIYTQNENSGTR